MEVGYAGRLSRKNLLQVDTFQPLTRFKDAKSGQDWSQMSGNLRDAFESRRHTGGGPRKSRPARHAALD